MRPFSLLPFAFRGIFLLLCPLFSLSSCQCNLTDVPITCSKVQDGTFTTISWIVVHVSRIQLNRGSVSYEHFLLVLGFLPVCGPLVLCNWNAPLRRDIERRSHLREPEGRVRGILCRAPPVQGQLWLELAHLPQEVEIAFSRIFLLLFLFFCSISPPSSASHPA